MTDVIPATDGQVEGWRNGALLLHPEGAHNPETLTGRVLAMAARIDAEKAARAEAEAERDALREQVGALEVVSDPDVADLDPETRDAIRDLCVAVAMLAHGTVALIGTDAAGHVMDAAGRLSARMDALDEREDR